MSEGEFIPDRIFHMVESCKLVSVQNVVSAANAVCVWWEMGTGAGAGVASCGGGAYECKVTGSKSVVFICCIKRAK